VAALSILGEGGEPGTDCWLRATPVHLRADLRRLLVFDCGDFPPERAEADALVGLFNRHFAEAGLALEAPHPSRWYLRSAVCPDVRTRPLGEVLGRSPELGLPAGPDAARWRSLMNETQMLFHDAETNRAREARGVPTLNGLWLDGTGRLPVPPPRPLDAVQGGDPLLTGIARLCGAECGPLPDRPGRLPPDDARIMVLYDRLPGGAAAADPLRWAAALEGLERWMAPLVQVLRARPGARLRLYPLDGRVLETGRGALGRFWRRPRPLKDRVRLTAPDLS
jgi:hypothetical protein